MNFILNIKKKRNVKSSTFHKAPLISGLTLHHNAVNRVRCGLFPPTGIKLFSTKLKMPSSPLSLRLSAISQNRVEAFWPSSLPSLIPGDTEAAPAFRRSQNLSREKAAGEAELMASWQATGWLRGPGALLKMAAVKRCDVESHRAKARLPLADFPHRSNAAARLKTLSHAFESLCRQNKCRQARLSS